MSICCCDAKALDIRDGVPFGTYSLSRKDLLYLLGCVNLSALRKSKEPAFVLLEQSPMDAEHIT